MSEWLRIDKLHYGYDTGVIIPSLSFNVPKGHFTCLLGPSGSGKTTLLRLIAGLETVQQGNISLDGAILSDHAHHVSPDQRHIGMVFQQPTLFPTLSVKENVAFGIRYLPEHAREQRIAELVEHVGLTKKIHVYPHQLSGGEQHRVALARAMAPQVKLLLLDEPFAHLDPDRRKRLRQQTLELVKKEGVTCMMVTHDPEEAMLMGDQIVLLDAQGNIRQQGTAHDIYHHPVDIYAARALGDMNLLEATSDGKRISSPLGEFETLSNQSGNVLLGVRPQDCGVDTVEGGVDATVKHVLCTGPEDHLDVELSSGDVVRARVPHDHHFCVDDSIRVSVNPERVHIYPAAT